MALSWFVVMNLSALILNVAAETAAAATTSAAADNPYSGQPIQHTEPVCCSNKTVGGLLYSLTSKDDNSAFDCLNSCRYAREDEEAENIYCFAAGPLKVECHDRGTEPVTGTKKPLTEQPTPGTNDPVTGTKKPITEHPTPGTNATTTIPKTRTTKTTTTSTTKTSTTTNKTTTTSTTTTSTSTTSRTIASTSITKTATTTIPKTTTTEKNKNTTALFVCTGRGSPGEMSSCEILIEGTGRMFISKQVHIKASTTTTTTKTTTNIGGCSSVPDFPIATSSATGSLFNGLPHICPKGRSSQCFGFKLDGSWENAFILQKPLTFWGSSVIFGNWMGFKTPWWIVGGDATEGDGTEVWGGNPPAEISGVNIKLPMKINRPCMTIISQYEAFVTAIPVEPSISNYAWIFNIQANNWTRLPNTFKERSGAACGYLETASGRFVVVAGGSAVDGSRTDTTEIFNLATGTWTMGPSIGVDLFGGSIVSVSGDTELLLVGGRTGGIGGTALTEIRRMDSSMTSWVTVGNLTTARYNAVALAVPVEDLPPLCP